MSRALELARKGNYDALILDSSAAATDVAENLLLERTNVQDDDAGFYILQEDFGTETSQSNLVSDDQTIAPEDQVMFHVNLLADQTISTNTITKLNFDYVNYNYRNNANCDDESKVVIKIPGIYYLRHQTFYSVSANASFGVYEYVYLYVNGGAELIRYQTTGYSGGSGYQWVHQGSKICEGMVRLNVGDEIEGYVYFYKGGTLSAVTYGIAPNYRDMGIQGTLIKRMPHWPQRYAAQS